MSNSAKDRSEHLCVDLEDASPLETPIRDQERKTRRKKTLSISAIEAQRSAVEAKRESDFQSEFGAKTVTILDTTDDASVQIEKNTLVIEKKKRLRSAAAESIDKSDSESHSTLQTPPRASKRLRKAQSKSPASAEKDAKYLSATKDSAATDEDLTMQTPAPEKPALVSASPPPNVKKRKKEATVATILQNEKYFYDQLHEQTIASAESAQQVIELANSVAVPESATQDERNDACGNAGDEQFDAESNQSEAIVVPNSAYNVGSMTRLLMTAKWPPVQKEMSRSACIFVLQYLENLFLIGDAVRNSDAGASDSGGARPPGSCYRAPGSDDESSSGSESLDQSTSREQDSAIDAHQRGPAPDYEDYCFTYSPRQIKELLAKESIETTMLIVKRAFGMSNQSLQEKPHGNVIDVEQVDLLEKGMHTYLFILKTAMLRYFNLLPIQVKDQHSNALQMAREVEASRSTSLRKTPSIDRMRDTERVNAAEPQPANIEMRLTDLHHRIANSSRYLFTTNLIIASNNRPHGLPLHLRSFGLVDREPNQASSVLQRPLRSRQFYLLHLLQVLTLYPLRRFGDDFYVEIKSGGHRTQAYTRFCSIKEWVNRNMPSCETDYAMWQKASEDTNTRQSIIEYLTNIVHKHDDVLCDLVTVRHQFSFRNGIYTAINNRFWRYDRNYYNEPDCPLGNSECISVKYIDNDFDESTTTCDIGAIKTPAFDFVMETQEFTKQVQYFFRMFCGRLMYKVNELDQWQVVPILIGFGGTGKSSILEAIAAMFPNNQVGKIQNKCEDLFGLESLYNMLLLLGMDIRPDWAMNQGSFQNMACGEPMAIARKNRMALQIENWHAPMVLASNTGLGYKDDGGAVTRRLMPFYFNIPVRPENIRPNLKAELLKELPNIMVKNNRCYLEILKRFPGAPLSRILPPDMRRNQNELRRDCGVIETYIKHCARCDENELDVYITKSDFVAAVRAYVKEDLNKNFDPPKDRDFVQQLTNAFDESAEELAGEKKNSTVKRAPRYVKKVTLDNGATEMRIYGIKLPIKNDHSNLCATACVLKQREE